MRLSKKYRPVLFSYAAILLFIACFSVANAQSTKKIPARSDWQTNLKRMYFFGDINDGQNNHIEYTEEGKFSIHNATDNTVLFAGRKINNSDTSALLINPLLFIIDPGNVSRAAKTENIFPVEEEFEATLKSFSVFPNPIEKSQREITLGFDDFEKGKEIQMSLFDLQGRQVSQHSFKVDTDQKTIAIPQLSSGFYVITINEKNNHYSTKLLVK